MICKSSLCSLDSVEINVNQHVQTRLDSTRLTRNNVTVSRNFQKVPPLDDFVPAHHIHLVIRLSHIIYTHHILEEILGIISTTYRH